MSNEDSTGRRPLQQEVMTHQVRKGTLVLRDASVGDLPAASRLIRESGAYQGVYLPQAAGRELSRDYLDAVVMRVLVHDAEVVGFYTVDVPGRGSPGEGELDWMIVHDDWQGLGLGSFLLDDAKRSAGCLGLTALVIVAHPPAAAFYERCGAQPAGVLAPEGKATWERPVFRLPTS